MRNKDLIIVREQSKTSKRFPTVDCVKAIRKATGANLKQSMQIINNYRSMDYDLNTTHCNWDGLCAAVSDIVDRQRQLETAWRWAGVQD